MGGLFIHKYLIGDASDFLGNPLCLNRVTSKLLLMGGARENF